MTNARTSTATIFSRNLLTENVKESCSCSDIVVLHDRSMVPDRRNNVLAVEHPDAYADRSGAWCNAWRDWRSAIGAWI